MGTEPSSNLFSNHLVAPLDGGDIDSEFQTIKKRKHIATDNGLRWTDNFF